MQLATLEGHEGAELKDLQLVGSEVDGQPVTTAMCDDVNAAQTEQKIIGEARPVKVATASTDLSACRGQAEAYAGPAPTVGTGQ